MTLDHRRSIAATALGAASLGAFVAGLTLPAPPAQAQMSVFDPRNYAQNLLTAARTLQAINNQVRSLQNEAQMLVNQAKNLTRIEFPELQRLTQTLRDVERLMGQAQAIDFRVAGLDAQFARLFPERSAGARTTGAQGEAARARLDAAMAAFRQTMRVQAQVVENLETDAGVLGGLVARSQSADGGLQAQQATNQLLALGAKQQFQIQQLMAAQFRADSVEAARRAEAETAARAATRKFLGSGRAYTPR